MHTLSLTLSLTHHWRVAYEMCANLSAMLESDTMTSYAFLLFSAGEEQREPPTNPQEWERGGRHGSYAGQYRLVLSNTS